MDFVYFPVRLPPTTFASMTTPTKRIISPAHLQQWLASPTHAEVIAFIERLNSSITAVKLSEDIPESPVRSLDPPHPAR